MVSTIVASTRVVSKPLGPLGRRSLERKDSRFAGGDAGHAGDARLVGGWGAIEGFQGGKAMRKEHTR